MNGWRCRWKYNGMFTLHECSLCIHHLRFLQGFRYNIYLPMFFIFISKVNGFCFFGIKGFWVLNVHYKQWLHNHVTTIFHCFHQWCSFDIYYLNGVYIVSGIFWFGVCKKVTPLLPLRQWWCMGQILGPKIQWILW